MDKGVEFIDIIIIFIIKNENKIDHYKRYINLTLIEL